MKTILIISLLQLVLCKSLIDIPGIETPESEDDNEFTIEEMREYEGYISSLNSTEFLQTRNVIFAPSIRSVLTKLHCKTNQIYMNGSCRDLVRR